MELSKITDAYRRFFLEFDLTSTRNWIQLIIIGVILFAYFKWLRWWFKNKKQHHDKNPEETKNKNVIWNAKKPYLTALILGCFFLHGEKIVSDVQALLILFSGAVLIDKFIVKKTD